MGYNNGQGQSQTESGRGGKGEKGNLGLPGIGFNLTDKGDFDIDGKRLADVAEPKDKNDAATRDYVDNTDATAKLYVVTKNVQQDIAINSQAEKNEAILRDGTQSMKGN